MLYFRKLKIFTPLLTVMALLFMQVAPVQAAMVSNQQLLSQAEHNVTVKQVMATLDRSDVQKKLISLGVDPEAAKARVSKMNNQELAKLAQGMDKMPAGSGILGLVVVVFVVLVITDMLGATDVFSFVHDINHR